MIKRRGLDQDMLLPERVRNASNEPSTRLVQITRTIPFDTYNFAPGEGIQSIAQSYANAFSNIKNFLYIEDEYFWLHAFIGVEIADFGPSNPDMELNINLLAQTLEREPVHLYPARTTQMLDVFYRCRSESPARIGSPGRSSWPYPGLLPGTFSSG